LVVGYRNNEKKVFIFDAYFQRMKPLFLFVFFVAIFLSCKKDKTKQHSNPPNGEDTGTLKDYNKDIIIANWNIEWFGDGAMFKGNLTDQENNAGKILKYLNADLYGLCEIVDTARFGRMIRTSLGDEFRYHISYYTSGSQKLAYVYNRNIFRKVSVRPYMGVSSQAFYNFGTRYPYLLTAELAVNGTKKTMSVVLIHAKANADIDSYNRRFSGSKELKDSLDKDFTGKNFLLLGDFNDNFDKSITMGKPSPYQNFLVDFSRYHAITQPLNVAGNQSTLGYANSVIDQQIISSSMTKWYKSNSSKIRTDVSNAVSNYTTGNTSDHYPITSVYHFSP